MSELPKVKIGKKTYYVDERLGQLRNVDNPHDFREICGSYWYYGKYIKCQRQKGHKGDHWITGIGCCWKGKMTDYDKDGLKNGTRSSKV